MAQCTVRLRKVPTKRKVAGRQKLELASDFGELVGLDISDTIVQLFSCELKEQERLENDPTNITINGGSGPQNIRTNVTIGYKSKSSNLVYKATAFFSRAEEMKAAAFEAYKMLLTLTRQRTGLAKNNYAIYVGRVGKDTPGKFQGLGIGSIASIDGNTLDADNTISVVGPLTTYGRKLYWNPRGGKTVNKRFGGSRKAKELLGIDPKSFFIGSATIHGDVKKRLRGKKVARAFSVSDPFYFISPRRIVGTYPETMDRPLRMPAITIQLKGRGRIR